MNKARALRFGLAATATVALLGLGAILACGALLQSARGRDLLVAELSTLLHRPVQVSGAVSATLLSLHPRLQAQGVTLGNPPWIEKGITARIGLLSVAGSWHLSRGFAIESLHAERVELTLKRDEEGRANWQFTDPALRRGGGLPVMHGVSVTAGHLKLEDAQRHISYEGTLNVSAQDTPAGRLLLEGQGTMNGAQSQIRVSGDPLATMQSGRPYGFTIEESNAAARLSAQGTLQWPLDFRSLDLKFSAEGKNLKSLSQLTGLPFINTAPFHISGQVARRGRRIELSELQLLAGASDVSGQMTFDGRRRDRHMTAQLSSQLLRSEDMGAAVKRAEQDSTGSAAPLLSEAAINPDAVRRLQAQVAWQAERWQAGRFALTKVSAHGNIQDGVLHLDPLTGTLLGGALRVRAELDANQPGPPVKIDITGSDWKLSEWHAQDKAALLDGALQLNVSISGRGTSLHQVAASADGTLTALIKEGVMRASLAEITGVDLRGVRLLLGQSEQSAQIRCAALKLFAQRGIFRVQSLVVDTDPVSIQGEGSIRMDSESYDMRIHGEPKQTRVLRLRAPLKLAGTLRRPLWSIDTQGSKFLLVDRGQGLDADCEAVRRNGP